ncbi:hypothetical protein MBLNU13_g03518t2 [Cladosporium sp. NU13]
MAPNRTTRLPFATKESSTGKRKRDGEVPVEGDGTSTRGIRKTTSNRRETEKILHPGDPTKPSSIELFDKREAQCATYLCYSDVRDLRRFVLSDQFLRIYYRSNQAWSVNMNVKKTLALILTDYVGECRRGRPRWVPAAIEPIWRL